MFGKKELNLTVKGMTCGGCEKKVIEALKVIPNVKNVNADHTKDSVSIQYRNDLDIEKVKKSIEDVGYEVISA